MGVLDDLKSEVAGIFRENWNKPEGRVVPEPDDLGLGNDGRMLEATVLYADMAESTNLVSSKKAHFAAEVYKAFLICCARMVRYHGGQITAYDGDRIMGIYVGDNKNTNAVKTALRINYAVKNIVQPAIKAQYSGETYELGHAVGIETSSILAARIGVRKYNDLVWVGKAANLAARYATFRADNKTSWISKSVYDIMNTTAREANGTNMWTSYPWNGTTVYGSNWTWAP